MRLDDRRHLSNTKPCRSAAVSRSASATAVNPGTSIGMTYRAGGCGRRCSPAKSRWSRPRRSPAPSGTRARASCILRVIGFGFRLVRCGSRQWRRRRAWPWWRSLVPSRRSTRSHARRVRRVPAPTTIVFPAPRTDLAAMENGAPCAHGGTRLGVGIADRLAVFAILALDLARVVELALAGRWQAGPPRIDLVPARQHPHRGGGIVLARQMKPVLRRNGVITCR